MAVTVYILCTLTSGLCALLLIREHRRTASRLLLWGALSFGALSISNALVILDLVVLPDIDLALLRASSFFVATALFLYGLLRDAE